MPQAIKNNFNLPGEIFNDHILTKLPKEDLLSFRVASKELKEMVDSQHKEIAAEIVMKNPKAITEFDEEWQNDMALNSIALFFDELFYKKLETSLFIEYQAEPENEIQDQLLSDQEKEKIKLKFIESSFFGDNSLPEKIIGKFRNNRAIMLAAVQKNNRALKIASKELKDDWEVVMAAVQKNGKALQYASDRLKNDPDIVMKAVQTNCWALEDASEELKNNRKIVMAALQQKRRNLSVLDYAGEELKNDREVVMAALQQSGYALAYVGEEFKNDPDIVMAAVQRTGWALQYAREYKNDRKIVEAAVRQN